MKAGKIILLQTESESLLQFYFNNANNMALKEGKIWQRIFAQYVRSKLLGFSNLTPGSTCYSKSLPKNKHEKERGVNMKDNFVSRNTESKFFGRRKRKCLNIILKIQQGIGLKIL